MRNSNVNQETLHNSVAAQRNFWSHWAMLISIFILSLIFGLGWQIKYSETISGEARIRSENEPQEIYPHIDGTLTKLLVQSNDSVYSGEMIGLIGGGGSHTEVFTLGSLLEKCNLFILTENLLQVSHLFYKPLNHLGTLQSSYDTFRLASRWFDHFGQSNKEKGTASQYLCTERQKAILVQAFSTLKHQFDAWKNTYIIWASTSGKILLNMPLKNGQILRKNVSIAQIKNGIAKYYADISLSAKDAEKVTLGNSINLLFFNFQHKLIRSVKGLISEKKLSENDRFTVTSMIPDTLISSLQNMNLDVQSLNIESKIMTKKTRLLKRLYHNPVR